MYKEIDGDLLKLAKEGKFDIIGHGCNCKKIMGAGIAKQVKDQFPGAYKADQRFAFSPVNRLGNFSIYSVNPEEGRFTILNIYTQYSPGPDLSYAALELALFKMTLVFKRGNKIGLPRIGCGIAGGDWEIVKEIIQRVLSEYDVTIVNYVK